MTRKHFTAKHLICWGLFFIYLAFLLGYQSTHSRYIPLEMGATFYDIWAVQFGIMHMPFYAIPRPGFMINTPLMMAGFSPFSIIIATICFMVLVPFALLFGLKPRLIRHPLFPLLTTLAYMQSFRPLDYETAPILFAMLSLGLLFLSFRKSSWQCSLLILFSSVCMAYSGFSNAGILPAVVVVVFVIGGIFNHRKSWSFALLSIIFLAGVYAWYYGLHAQYERMVSHSVRVGSQSLSDNLILAKLARVSSYLLAVLVSMSFVVFLNHLAFQVQSRQIKMWLSGGFSMISFALMAIFIADKVWFQCLLFMVLSFMFGCFYLLNKTTFTKPFVATLLTIWLLMIAHQTNSLNPNIMDFFYMPYLLLLLAVLVLAIESPYLKRSVLALLFVSAMILLSIFITPWGTRQGLVAAEMAPSWAYQYPAYFGKWVTPTLHCIYKQVDVVYAQHDCQQKPLLVIGNPGMYFKYKRLAPFDTPWLSRESIIPDNGRVRDKALINWLDAHQHWCVVFATTAPNRVSDGQKRFFLSKFEPYVKQQANYQKYVGYDWYQDKGWSFYAK